MARKPSKKTPPGKPTNSPKRGRRKPVGVKRVASEQADNRANGGRFAKGRSGNPGGRPKALLDMQEMARAHTEEAIHTLALWMREGDGKVAVAAANALLDRAWGKAAQPITGKDGGPVDVNLNEVRGAIASKLDRIAATALRMAQ